MRLALRSRPNGLECRDAMEAELDARVTTLVGNELLAVEALIRRELHSAIPLIQETVDYVARAEARRLRPILLLLTTRLGSYDGSRAVLLASVVELLHTAALIHDDVVDAAPLRGGGSSANVRWGVDASVLIGDYVYAKSFGLLIADNDPDVITMLVRSTVSMTEAAVQQLQRRRNRFLSESEYLSIATRRTAWLMSACCRIGARLGGLPRRQVEALARYGLAIGIAWRMFEDLRSQWMRREHNGVEHPQARASVFARAAKKQLHGFAPSPEREALSFLADFVGALHSPEPLAPDPARVSRNRS
jgi:octaprenyl-diphosphate synthase